MVGLDLGSTKLAVAVGELNPDRSVTVLASIRYSSNTPRNVIDIESSVRAIDELLDGIERILGHRLAVLVWGLAVLVCPLYKSSYYHVTHSNNEIT